MRLTHTFLVFLAILLLPFPVAAEKAGGGGDRVGKRARAGGQGPSALTTAHKLIQKARKRIEEIEDYTAIFHKREYVDGKFQPETIAKMKVRLNPRRIYMKWIGKVHKGRELLWGKGWNGGKIKAHEGGLLGLITVNLDPEGKKAMKGNRHSIADAGFGYTIELIARDLGVARKNPEYLIAIKDLGEKKIYGQKARGFDARLDKAEYPKFYGYRARVWIHCKLNLPVRIQIWDREDEEVRLVEDYGYAKIRTDVGLTGEDFDPDNPDYGF
jgi:hypothetical protein